MSITPRGASAAPAPASCPSAMAVLAARRNDVYERTRMRMCLSVEMPIGPPGRADEHHVKQCHLESFGSFRITFANEFAGLDDVT